MFKVLLLAVHMLGCTWASAAQFKGIVYSDSQGPSGTGTGDVRIATEQSIFQLHYQKPLQGTLKSAICQEPGAVWTVAAQVTHPGLGILESARCDGTVDTPIHAGWLIAKRYLDLAASRSYSAANLIRSTRASKSSLKDDIGRLEDLDLQGYRAYGFEGRCMSVKIKEDDSTVVLQAGDSCLIRRNSGENISLSLRLVNEGIGKGWRIDKLVAFR